MRRPGVRSPSAPPIESNTYGEALLAVFVFRAAMRRPGFDHLAAKMMRRRILAVCSGTRIVLQRIPNWSGILNREGLGNGAVYGVKSQPTATVRESRSTLSFRRSVSD